MPGQALAHVEVGVAARVLVRVAALDVQAAELVEVGGCREKKRSVKVSLKDK